jgi:cyclophilin family peptidyl-prolyl cis-trans isomerase
MNALPLVVLPLLVNFAPALVQQEDSRKSPASRPAANEKPKAVADLTQKDKAIVAIDKFLRTKRVSTRNKAWREALFLPPMLPFAAQRDYLWVLKTNKGEFTVRLLVESAPRHCSNAIYLTRLGFYDGLTFHRVIEKFMAQGGCPNGTGTSTIGYHFDGEFEKKVGHDKPGLISAANAGPDTDGSQFFVTFAPAPHLDGKHTVYGEVIAGMEAVTAIEACAGKDEKPTERIVIERATIRVVEKPRTTPAGK